jgi:hypothetical protein
MIEKILKASVELAEKETLIAQEYEQLLFEINQELIQIPEREIYEIRWEVSGSGNAPREIDDYAVHAVMSIGLYPEIFLQGSRDSGGGVESSIIRYPSVKIIQLFARQLEGMLKYFKRKLEEDRPELRSAIPQLAKLLDRVGKEKDETNPDIMEV